MVDDRGRNRAVAPATEWKSALAASSTHPRCRCRRSSRLEHVKQAVLPERTGEIALHLSARRLGQGSGTKEKNFVGVDLVLVHHRLADRVDEF